MQSKADAEALAAQLPAIHQEHIAEMQTLRQVLGAKKGQVYALTIDFKESDPQAGNYGTVRFKLFRMSDVAYLTSRPVFQRQSRAMLDNKPLTEDEQKQLFELHCEMLARVLVRESAMSKQELIDMDDYRFVEIVFGEICERSGMGARAVQDIQHFLLTPQKAAPSG